ncbi:hypothetical protein [Micromonospora sp. NPDC049679]|uniref:hypothetical protein n=1 Tax=Micromonospora sp. NPDC049679 TaxID=3155920 RepID=UPI0033D51529
MVQTRDEAQETVTSAAGRTTPILVDRTGRRRGLGPTGRTNPVFVDKTGRRRRLAVLAGTGMAASLMAWLGLLLAGLVTDAPLPIPGWPEAGNRPQQGQVAERRVPSPTPLRDPATVRTAGPAARTAPTVTRPPTVPANRPPRATDRPGLGDEHRSTPRAKPSKSTGKRS